MLRSVEMVGRFEAHLLPDGSTVYYEPDPKHAYFGEVKPNPKSEGGYSFVQSSRLTGVSTIAKHLDVNADPLMRWAVGLEHVGIAELVARHMEAGGDLTWLTDPARIGAKLADAESTWEHVRDRMAEWGTNVHEHVFLALAHGNVPDLADRSDEERGFAQAAMSWWRDRTPEVEAAEQVTVSHDKRFAGRFDLKATLDVDGTQVNALVDAKTRTSGRERLADHVQTVGYDIANRDCGIGPSEAQLVLLLMPDGTYREVWSAATEADFYAALTACQTGKHLDKRMRQATKARKAVTT